MGMVQQVGGRVRGQQMQFPMGEMCLEGEDKPSVSVLNPPVTLWGTPLGKLVFHVIG